MDKKLTLSLNRNVIEKAKAYAKQYDTSLSKLIESYLDSLTKDQTGNASHSTVLVESLSGVISLPADYNYKEDRVTRLVEKHK